MVLELLLLDCPLTVPMEPLLEPLLLEPAEVMAQTRSSRSSWLPDVPVLRCSSSERLPELLLQFDRPLPEPLPDCPLLEPLEPLPDCVLAVEAKIFGNCPLPEFCPPPIIHSLPLALLPDCPLLEPFELPAQQAPDDWLSASLSPCRMLLELLPDWPFIELPDCPLLDFDSPLLEPIEPDVELEAQVCCCPLSRSVC